MAFDISPPKWNKKYYFWYCALLAVTGGLLTIYFALQPPQCCEEFEERINTVFNTTTVKKVFQFLLPRNVSFEDTRLNDTRLETMLATGNETDWNHLVEINLRRNRITGDVLPLLSNLSNLMRVDLTRNWINKLPPRSLSNLTSLIRLNLDDNDLWHAAKEGLERQIAFDFGTNETIPGPPIEISMRFNKFCPLYNPFEWFFSNPLITDGDHGQPLRLVDLNLDYNNLTALNERSFAWPHYRTLSMKWNHLHRIANHSFANQRQLTAIILSHNLLADNSFEARSLVLESHSYLTDPNTTRSPSPFRLVLDHNQFAHFSPSFALALSELDLDLELDLTYNIIRSISFGNMTLPHLRVLRLAHNDITHLHGDLIASLPRILHLDLGHNLLGLGGIADDAFRPMRFNETEGFMTNETISRNMTTNETISNLNETITTERAQISEVIKIVINLDHNRLFAGQLAGLNCVDLVRGRSEVSLGKVVELHINLAGNPLYVLPEKPFKDLLDLESEPGHYRNHIELGLGSKGIRWLECYNCANHWWLARDTYGNLTRYLTNGQIGGLTLRLKEYIHEGRDDQDPLRLTPERLAAPMWNVCTDTFADIRQLNASRFERMDCVRDGRNGSSISI